MRKIIVLLLVIGFLAGTCAVACGFEEYSLQKCTEFLDNDGYGEVLGDPAPCGDGGSGGPPGLPG